MFTKFCKVFAIAFGAIALLFIPLTLLGQNSEATGFIDRLFNNWLHEGYYLVNSWTVFLYVFIDVILSGLIAVCVVFIGEKLRKKQVEVAVKSPIANQAISFWSMVFYAIMFFVLTTLVMSFFLRGSGVGYGETVSGYAMMAIVLLLLVSAFVGSLAYGVVSLWKKEKVAPAIVIGIIALLAIPISWVPYFEINPSRIYDDTYIESEYPTEAEGYEPESPSYTESESVESEFEKIEVPNPYFAKLWEDPSTDKANVASAFNNTFYGGEDYESDDENVTYSTLIDGYRYSQDGGFLKIKKYIKSHTQTLFQIFDSYADLIYYLVPSYKYNNHGYSALCNRLLFVYSCIYQNKSAKDVDEYLNTIYQIMDSPDNRGLLTSEYFDLLKPYIHTASLSKFPDINGNLDKDNIVWAYSFWARRHHEKSDATTCRILNTIKNHYK